VWLRPANLDNGGRKILVTASSYSAYCKAIPLSSPPGDHNAFQVLPYASGDIDLPQLGVIHVKLKLLGFAEIP